MSNGDQGWTCGFYTALWGCLVLLLSIVTIGGGFGIVQLWQVVQETWGSCIGCDVLVPIAMVLICALPCVIVIVVAAIYIKIDHDRMVRETAMPAFQDV